MNGPQSVGVLDLEGRTEACVDELVMSLLGALVVGGNPTYGCHSGSAGLRQECRNL